MQELIAGSFAIVGLDKLLTFSHLVGLYLFLHFLSFTTLYWMLIVNSLGQRDVLEIVKHTPECVCESMCGSNWGRPSCMCVESSYRLRDQDKRGRSMLKTHTCWADLGSCIYCCCHCCKNQILLLWPFNMDPHQPSIHFLHLFIKSSKYWLFRNF